jgi:uncharacterized protein (TIGR02145 family)
MRTLQKTRRLQKTAKIVSIFLILVVSVGLLAANHFRQDSEAIFNSPVTPSQGSTTGGTTVTITGDFKPPAPATLQTMQQMTEKYCANMTVYDGTNPGVILTPNDSRGSGQQYQVAKLADGNCWMLNNLKLGSTSGTLQLTPQDTNIKTSWTLPRVNTSGAPSTTEYYNLSVVDALLAGDSSYSSSTPNSQETDITSPNFAGYYYNWCAATAGGTASGGSNTCTASTTMPSNATNDICPAGWRLPTGYDTGEFAWLNAKMNNPNATGPSSSPYYTNWLSSGIFKGILNGIHSSSGFDSMDFGAYWSSSRDATRASWSTNMVFHPSGYYFDPAWSTIRGNGIGVRCLADDPTPTVTFGGTAATNVSAVDNGNGTQTITATVPAHVAGLVSVVVNNGTTDITLPSSYQYYDAPTITGVYPNFGPSAGGNSVTVTGTNFAVQSVTFSQVAAGEYTSLAIDTDGNLYTWGSDGYGQIGNGATTGDITSPWQVNGGTNSGIASSTKFSQVAANAFNSLAIDIDGNLYVWGSDSYGQIGNGSITGNVTTPWKVNGGTGSGIASSTKFSRIAAGTTHSLAIDTDGNLYTWGSDSSGQIGNGATSGNVTTPWTLNGGTNSSIPAEPKFTHIAAGDYTSLAIDAEGNLYTWGSNSNGQIGNGAASGNVTTPWKVNGGTGSGVASNIKFSEVASGSFHSMAIDTAGNLYVWGDDGWSQIGNGATPSAVTTPWKLNGGTNSGITDATKFAQVAAGDFNSAAIDTDGNLYTWGDNTRGQIGGNPSGEVDVPWQVNGGTGSGVAASTKFVAITMGWQHSLAIDFNGNLYAWGDDSTGQIGNGSTTGNITAPWRLIIERSFSVSLDGSECKNVNIISPNALTCTAPAHAAGLVNVVVNDSVSNASKSDAYLYYDPMTVTDVSPSSGSTAGGTDVTITGSGFTTSTPILTTDFSYTGTMQTFTALAAGTYKLEVWGAQGTQGSSVVSGMGGYSVGIVNLVKGDQLGIYVGGQNGYNGGGCYGASGSYVFPGGGGTDIRIGGAALTDRIIVAGGGGGTYSSYESVGYGGGTNGGPNVDGNGGSQTSGYSFGAGSCYSGGYGGGGGGWYGGWGSDHGNGSGGSGYVFTLNSNKTGYGGSTPNGSYYLASALTTAGNFSFTAPGGGSETGHTGDGYARITPVSASIATTVTFDNADCTNVQVVNSTKITCTTPSNAAGLANVTVDNGLTNASKTKAYTYYDPMTITGVAPDKGLTTGNTNVTITGTNFAPSVTVEDFLYTGAAQTFTVPAAGTYKLEVWGAQGGSSLWYGGNGGYSVGEVSLTAGSKLSIYIGGQNGYNGGGSAGGSSGNNGGGGTDVRLGGASLADRIIVAGGGGGADGGWCSGFGGAGGGLQGMRIDAGCPSGYGGTQSDGGASGGNNGQKGSLGLGGNGSPIDGQPSYSVPGGGGGYYGGGSGGSLNASSGPIGAGAGGSGYVGTLANAQTIAGDGASFPAPSGGNETGHTGDGYARITPVSVSLATTVTFDGVAATNVTVVDNTTITATTPAHGAGLVDVKVSNYLTSATKSSGYLYHDPMTITSITPNYGLEKGGTNVTISGNNINQDSLYAQISAGSNFSVAIDAAGHLYAWGYDNNGQLGDGGACYVTETVYYPTDDASKKQRILNDWGYASADDLFNDEGSSFGVAITSWDELATVYMLDWDFSGDYATMDDLLDDLGYTGDLEGFLQDYYGYYDVSSLLDWLYYYAWGFTDSETVVKQSGCNTPQRIVGGAITSDMQFTDVTAGDGRACAVSISGNVYCWGQGYLGNGVSNNSKSLPVQVKGVGGTGFLSNIRAIEGRATNTCAISLTNVLYCWGSNSSGTMGSGGTSTTPVQLLTDVQDISVGYSHICALKTNGTVWCWGSKTSGALGDGVTSGSSSTPIQVKGVSGSGFLSNIVSISSGYYYSCAVDSTGGVYCWGYNTYGQLGNNSVTSSSTPVRVLGVGGSGYLSGITQVTTSNIIGTVGYTCAVDNSGSVYCWGYNTYGQLGNNSTTMSRVPVAVLQGAMPNQIVKQVSVGNYHTCVVGSDSKTYCWGSNTYGQLGNAANTNQRIPTAVKSDFINVILDASGTPAKCTNVVVAGNGKSLTCTTAAHTPGLVSVTVSNSLDSITLSATCSIATSVACNGRLDNGETRHQDRSNVVSGFLYEEVYVSISLSGNLVQIGGVNGLTPNSSGVYGSATNTATTTTNNPTGYLLSISTNELNASSNAKDLKHTYLSQYIVGTANTCTWSAGALTNTTNVLANNTWGFTLNAINRDARQLCQVPAKDNALTVKATNTDNGELGDSLNLYYGSKMGLTKPSGNYQGTVIYTVTAGI